MTDATPRPMIVLVMEVSPFQYYFFLFCALCLLCILIPTQIFLFRGGRAMPLARNLIMLRRYLSVAIGYLIVNSLEVLAWTEGSTLFFMKLCYFFVTAVPIWFFLFALELSDRQHLSKSLAPYLWAFPALAFLIVLTNEYHHLNWGPMAVVRAGPFLALRALSYGPWFWFLWACMQGFVCAGGIITSILVIKKSRSFNRQSAIIVMGALTPLVINAIYVLRIIPGFQKDFSSIGFAISGALFAYGVFHDRLFDLIPIARRALVDALSDPLIALDAENRVVDANPAAKRICDLGDDFAESPASDHPFLSTIISALNDGATLATEASPDGTNWYEARMVDVSISDRALKLYTLRDITERRLLIEEKTAVADHLSRTLADIRTLRGIIPICASCKKIRDDSGYWQQVENYVESHTMVEFSHGLCPECRLKLYPDLDNSGTTQIGEDYDRPSQSDEG